MKTNKYDPAYDSIVIMGTADDKGSMLPGWDYPFSKAEEEAIVKLKSHGFKKTGVFREPDATLLRRLLAGENLRGVIFVGHGEFHGTTYSFRLNPKENLSAGQLHEWAKEDVVMKRHMSKEDIKRLAADPLSDMAVQRTASYNFDLSVFYTCNSLRDPELRSVMGGEFEGNPWYSLINLPPLMSHQQQTLNVSSEAFSKDPVNALQGALVASIKSIQDADQSLIQEGYRTALQDALAELIAAKRAGKNVLNSILDSLRDRFSIQLDPGLGSYEDITVDEAEEILEDDMDTHDEEVFECGVPTVSSHGELGCHHRIRGGGPCWQHEECFAPPEEEMA